MLEDSCSPNEILTLKNNLFQCLLELPLRTYVGSYVPLLHTICAELVSEKLAVTPSIYRGWLGEDDLLLDSAPTSLYQLLYEQSPQLYQESIYDTWLGLPLTHRFRFSLQQSSMLVNVLNNAVKLFAELFTSPVININNRLQLFKHFYGHVQTCNKQRDTVPGKMNKIVTILVTCLACLRRLSELEEVITDSELLSTLKAIVSALEGSAHPLTKRLQSLLSVHLCKASPDPASTPTFLKYAPIREIEQRATLSDYNPLVKGALVAFVGQAYAHFPLTHLAASQQAMGHIIQNSTRDERVGCWGITALYQAYNSHKDQVSHIVKATYPLAFHHYIHEEYEDPLAYQALVQLSCLILRVERERKDAVYWRAMGVVRQAWKERAREMWTQLPALIQVGVSFSLSEVAAAALDTLPSGFPVLHMLIVTGYGLWLLKQDSEVIEKLLNYYDSGHDQAKESEGLIRRLLILRWNTEQQKCFDYLLAAVTTADIRRTEESSTGMSAQDERREVETADKSESQRCWHSGTKIYCAKALLFLVKGDKDRVGNAGMIDGLVKLGGHLCACEEEEWKLVGMKMFKFLYRSLSHVADPADPSSPYLSLFAAHTQAAIRPYLTLASPPLLLSSCKLLEVVIHSRITQDRDSLSRMVQTLLNLLEPEIKVPILDEYSELAACEVHYVRILTLCKVYAGGQVDKVLFAEAWETMKGHIIAMATDLCVLLLEEGNRKLNYKHEIVPVTVKYMAEIEVFLGVLGEEKGMEDFLLPVCAKLLFIPFRAFDSSTFRTQKSLDRFLHRRLCLLRTLHKSLSSTLTPTLAEELLRTLSFISKDPRIDLKREILGICGDLIAMVGTVGVVREVEGWVVRGRLVKGVEEGSLQAWAACIKRYIGFMKEEVLDESSDMDAFKHSIYDYCMETARLRREEDLVSMLLLIVQETNEEDFKRTVCEDVLLQVWTTWQDAAATAVLIRMLAAVPIAFLSHLSHTLSLLRSALLQHNHQSTLLLSQLAHHSALFPFFSKEILSVFTMRKEEEMTEDEALAFSEAMKIVLIVYKQAAQKEVIVTAILPLLVSAYYKHTPVQLLKTVTQALQHFITSAPLPCRDFLGSLPEHEKNYLRDVLSKKVEADQPVVSKSQGSITLKIKKF
jgi:hypothetical protein